MQIFISRDGEQIGSWPEEDIRQYYQEGLLISTDHYWHEGMPQWELMDVFFTTLPLVISAPETAPAVVEEPAPEVPETWIEEPAPTFLVPEPVEPALELPEPAAAVTPVAVATPIADAPAKFREIPVRRDRPIRAETLEGPEKTLVPSWLIWSLAGAVLLVIVMIGLVAFERQHHAAQQVTAEMDSYAEQKQKETAPPPAQPEAGPAPAPPAATVASLPDDPEVDKLKALSAIQIGSAKKMTEVNLELLGQLATHLKACRVAEGQALALGLGPSSLATVSDLEERSAALRACRTPIQDLQTFIQNIDATSRGLLSAQAVGPDDTASFLTELHRTGKWDALMTYWELEGLIVADLSNRLELLKENWGKWHLNGSTLVFDDNDALDKYEANEKRLQDDIAQQKLTQKEAPDVPLSK
jgi:hypothetical protein